MKGKVIFACLMLIACLSVGVSCKKTKPQLPSNKKNINADKELDLRRLNQEMVEQEDEFLRNYVAENDSSFYRNEAGFWSRIDVPADSSAPLQNGDVCSISYKVSLLDGVFVEEVQNQQYLIGRKEIIPGLDMALVLLKRGETATFIFPWNLAYGMKGYNDLVPPYTSVMYKITVE